MQIRQMRWIEILGRFSNFATSPARATRDGSTDDGASKKVSWAPTSEYEVRIAATEIERCIGIPAKNGTDIDEQR